MMKRLPRYLLALILLIHFPAWAADIYVSPGGSDFNEGTKERPMATLAMALRKAREMRRLNDPSITGGIHIILQGGMYSLYEPVMVRPEDAGTSESPTYIESAPNETPVLSGGFYIKDWKKSTEKIRGLSTHAQGKVWEADVPLTEGRLSEFRQLWINDKKAVRAKSMNGNLMDRILSWNKKEQTCWIPTPKSPSLQGVTGMEMFIHQWWAIAILRIKRMEVHGDSSRLFFQQPESSIQSEHPWPAPWISKVTGNSAFYLTNTIQFLDEPGEWYLDVVNRKVYYWPRSNEDMATATVIAPSLPTLLKVEGTIDNPVSNIFFRGISFQYTGWLRPSEYGLVPHQAGMYMTEAYKLKVPGTKDKKTLENQAWIGRPASAAEVNYSDKITFENCRFVHLASTGLDYNKGVHDNVIKGNLFKDIGGTAILAGVFSDEATEVHLPYRPKDEREVCDRMLISNNLITDATNEDWGCVGIGLGYTRNSMVEHNEIENVSYTGISMGWGWSPAENVMRNNTITRNKIHHYARHNYDCAGIYTLSAQPGSYITENYVDSIYKAPYAHLPSHWFYLYTDEGSSYITIKDNWTPSQKYLQNANGPGNVWENNGPQVSASVKHNAGLQPEFSYLLSEKTSHLNHLSINTEHNEVIELVAPDNQTLNTRELKSILYQNKVDTSSIYRWKNHYVIFEKVKDIISLTGKLEKTFPEVQVKWYPDMFYQFNREYCDDKNIAKEWSNVVLTADLVADKKMQQQYLDYHTTQFEKWPEVAKGFCNADFQQVLGFKRGRQLILVISIPKGKDFEKLNLKTTENNPRVVEWNRLMSKYQEGIEGTKKGETWVFLQQLTR